MFSVRRRCSRPHYSGSRRSCWLASQASQHLGRPDLRQRGGALDAGVRARDHVPVEDLLHAASRSKAAASALKLPARDEHIESFEQLEQRVGLLDFEEPRKH